MSNKFAIGSRPATMVCRQVAVFFSVLLLIFLPTSCGKKNSSSSQGEGNEITTTTGKQDLPDNEGKAQKAGCEVFSEIKRIANESTASNTRAQVTRLKELSPQVPEKIRSAYDFVITSQESLLAIAADDPEGPQKSAAIQGAAEYKESQTKVADYSYDECGVNLRNSTS